jgi:elongation factor G
VPPLVELVVEPRSRADADRLATALRRLVSEDADFGFASDAETGQTVIKGLSESHLAGVVERFSGEFGIALAVGAPQVAYCETLGRRSEIDYTYKKQTGGSGQFARIKLVFEPGAPGSGYSFESKVVGGSVPKEFIPGVENGLATSRENGVLAGFPVIDFKVTLVDGAYHDVDSSALTFEIAARSAFREGLQKAECKLLEPIMAAEIRVPHACGTACAGDLKMRRGTIRRVTDRDELVAIDALVPLANMFGYDTSLRMLADKRGTFSLVFDHYAPVPPPDDDDDPFAPAVGLRA